MLDGQGNFKYINDTVERLTGFNANELIGRPYMTIIYKEDLDKAKWFFNERRTGDRAASTVELRLKTCDDNKPFRHCEVKHLTVELISTSLYDMPVTENDKKYLGTHGVARDITDRKDLEAQLLQAQKMEAVGTLASGIAHNFNNMLMGIQGNASLISMDTDSSHPHIKYLNGINEHVNNAADLTKQLFGFTRSEKYEIKPADLNEIMKKSSEMFGRTKKEITIHADYQENIWPVEIDQGQIEQVLLNLYVNAWQSMPRGGNLFIETENVYLNENFVNPYKVKPGDFVKISVRDTGVGIDKDIQKRVFEPFFTTKKTGGGTGLGLASAYGIIRNHDGIINVYSQPGQGATFNISLPASEKEIEREMQITEGYVKGSETILLVDDEDAIIDVGSQLLKNLGYEVLTAQSGEEAVEIFEGIQNEIQLIILDMIMPEVSGGETYDKLKEINPDIKVLLSSGYSVHGQASEILDRGCDGFIQKPFNLKNLSRKIRDLMDVEKYALRKN